MQHLGRVVAGSQLLQRKYETPNLPALTADRLPAETAPADVLVRLVTWRGTDGSIELARALTDGERRELERRRADLAPALEPFDRERPGDLDRAAEVAAGMYGSFPSMRQEGADALARVDSLMGSLVRHRFPVWAIEAACRKIQDDGYERSDGKKIWIERQWAPSDSEVARVVQRVVAGRAKALASATAILNAAVGR